MTDRSVAQHFSKAALDQMAELQVPATPENYRLWFHYVRGTNPQLNKSIDALLAKGEVPDEGELEKIHAAYFGVDELNSAILDVGEKITGEIDQVIDFLQHAAGANADFGDTLEGASAFLNRDTQVEHIRAIVDGLISATRKMEERSRILEDQLNRSAAEVQQLKTDIETIRHESLIDPLTGIANRKRFDEGLRNAILAAENGSDLCLLMGDIDFFKKFNDTWGHPTGDQVLRLVAHCLRQSVKGQDLPARYGGEEFAVILPGTTLNAAVTVAEQIREAVASKELVKRSTGEKLGTVTMSFGAGRLKSGESLEDFLARVDAHLYKAKQAGRNRVVCDLSTESNEGGESKSSAA